VGYRPSYDLASELQVHLCYASEGPMKHASAHHGATPSSPQVHLCYASEGPMKLASSLLSAKLKAMASGDAVGANDCLKQVRNACSRGRRAAECALMSSEWL
jgi:hypothetical protein